MNVRSRISPLTVAVIFIVVIGSALATSVTFTATAYAAPDNTSTYKGGYFDVAYNGHGNSSAPRHWSGTKSSSGATSWNVITNPQAQATGAGTIASSTNSWANGHNNGRNDVNGGITTHHHYYSNTYWNTYNWNAYNWNLYNNGLETDQLTIYTSGQGTTSPASGTYWYAAGSSVTVTAYPSDGYALIYWTIDGVNYAPSTTVTLVMNYGHTVIAHFTGGP